jgi:hypothetical protein
VFLKPLFDANLEKCTVGNYLTKEEGTDNFQVIVFSLWVQIRTAKNLELANPDPQPCQEVRVSGTFPRNGP